MLNDKELSILNSLYKTKLPTKIEELANLHKLSPRSIRSYVTRINKDLKFDCITLHKGSFQLSDPGFVDDFFENYQVSNYSSQVLVLFMLHKLVIDNKINLSHFVIEFEVSRTTAKNYLNQVKEQLESYHLKLDHSTGITLLGKESDKRQVFLNLLQQIQQRNRVELELISPLLAPCHGMISEERLQVFMGKMLSALDYELSEHSHLVLCNYLKIMLLRVSQGFPSPELFNRRFLENSEEYKQTCDIFKELEQDTLITLPLEEVLEFINKIMGLHYSTHKETEHHNWFEYDLFISKLIRRFSKACDTNLVGDFTLYENLLNHIKPAMYRIAHKISLHQFDHPYIIQHSPKEFALTEEILRNLHFYPQNPQIYQDETALICLHFKQALEKQKSEERKNVLLVSNYGYGSSRMMMEKIRQHYHLGKFEWIPSHELKNMDKSQFHLVISTDSTIEKPSSVPVIYISPFLERKDRHKLAEYLSPKESEKISLSQVLAVIEEHATITDLPKLKENLSQSFHFTDDTEIKSSISDFINEEMIVLDVKAQTVQEVLEHAGKLLESQGCIQASYGENLIDSFVNYGVYMMIYSDVAIPHTKNTGNVLKTGFTFIRTASPIDFENHALSLFVTFCTRNNKEHLEALILIADIVKDKLAKQSLQNLATPQEILAFLQQNESKSKGNLL